MNEPCEKCGGSDVSVILGFIAGLKVTLHICPDCGHESIKESFK